MLLYAEQIDATVAFGKIARTVDSTYEWSGGAASVYLDTTVTPYRSYNIFAETTMGSFYVGNIVHKMGRTTGHTYGPVTGTCVDEHPVVQTGIVDSTITDKLYLCQVEVNAYTQPGDSGSPVFLSAAYEDDVVLAGILWGYQDPGADVFIFSPIDGVHYDVGPFVGYPSGSSY